MSTTPLYKWHMYCITEGCDKTVICPAGVTPNIVCPTTTSDTMNMDSLHMDPDPIPGSVTPQVMIQQTDGHVTGKFITRSHNFIASGPPGTITTYGYSYNCNQCITVGDFVYDESQEGDIISIVIAPLTTIGVLLANANNGDTTITVSNTVAMYIHNGYFLTLTNGVTTSNEVEVININTDASPNVITVTPALVLGSTLGAGTTLVKFSYYMVRNRVLGPEAHLSVGATIKSGSSIIVGIPIHILYTRNYPEPKVALLTADCNIGDTTLTVSRNFLNYMMVGKHYLKLTDGTNTSSEVKYINFDDSSNSANVVITINPAIDTAFLAATPTKIIRTTTIPVSFSIEGLI